jgi:hypothetical protein
MILCSFTNYLPNSCDDSLLLHKHSQLLRWFFVPSQITFPTLVDDSLLLHKHSQLLRWFFVPSQITLPNSCDDSLFLHKLPFPTLVMILCSFTNYLPTPVMILAPSLQRKHKTQELAATQLRKWETKNDPIEKTAISKFKNLRAQFLEQGLIPSPSHATHLAWLQILTTGVRCNKFCMSLLHDHSSSSYGRPWTILHDHSSSRMVVPRPFQRQFQKNYLIFEAQLFS